jgi:hypothetical protein
MRFKIISSSYKIIVKNLSIALLFNPLNYTSFFCVYNVKPSI